MNYTVNRLPGPDSWEILNENGRPVVFPFTLDEALVAIKGTGPEVSVEIVDNPDFDFELPELFLKQSILPAI